MDSHRLTNIGRDFLLAIGEDPNREGLKDTPSRFSRATEEMLSGYTSESKLAQYYSKVFTTQNDSMVVETNIPVYSFCEHHLLPFYGTCNIGYIPNGKAIGLSKLTRIVEVFARRLQIQEELTSQIANSINDNLDCKGVMVTMRCIHMCMVYRGVKTRNSPMITSKQLGLFAESPSAKAEFFSLTGNEPPSLL